MWLLVENCNILERKATSHTYLSERKNQQVNNNTSLYSEVFVAIRYSLHTTRKCYSKKKYFFLFPLKLITGSTTVNIPEKIHFNPFYVFRLNISSQQGALYSSPILTIYDMKI